MLKGGSEVKRNTTRATKSGITFSSERFDFFSNVRLDFYLLFSLSYLRRNGL